MEDFELQLKQFRLARPSKDMKERIFGRKQRASGVVNLFRFRIPLGWAAVLVVLAGLSGGYFNQLFSGAIQEPQKQVYVVRLVAAPSESGNALDFTTFEPADGWLDGEVVETIVEPGQEIYR